MDTRGNTFSEFNGKKTCPICFSKKFIHFQFWENNKEKMWYRGIRADMCYQLSGGVPIEKVNGFYHLWTRLGLFQLFNQPKCISFPHNRQPGDWKVNPQHTLLAMQHTKCLLSAPNSERPLGLLRLSTPISFGHIIDKLSTFACFLKR